MAKVISNQKNYTIWKIEWPEILDGEETYDLAQELIKNLRAVDRREILAFTNDIAREVQESMNWSYELQYATTKNGQLIAVWGLQPKREKTQDTPGHALIWCLGTDWIHKYSCAFAKESKKILQAWAKEYGTLFNIVGAFNEEAIRWLKWVGAEFTSTEISSRITQGGEEFLPFIIR